MSLGDPQEIVRPDVFWYSAGSQVESPLGPVGLLAFEFFAMHWVEVRRWQDLRKPGSVDQDPIFSQYKLPPHEVGQGLRARRAALCRLTVVLYVKMNGSITDVFRDVSRSLATQVASSLRSFRATWLSSRSRRSRTAAWPW